MKRATIALLVLLAASVAVAGINTEKPLGPMNLYIDGAGVGTMVNDSDEPFDFDGYSIASKDGLIDPVAWIPLREHLDPWIPWPWLVPPPIEWEPLTWSVMSRTSHLISEACLSSAWTLTAGGEVDLGAAFPGGTQADLTFTYVNSAKMESYEGRVIPEPATISLLALGALAAARRRR